MKSRKQSFKKLERRLIAGEVPETTRLASERMSRVRQRDTAPEMRVRRALAALGWRYRIVNRDLPGSPDLANRSRKWALFVHGCYWHHHDGCPKATVPKANREFWLAKFAMNRQRDARVQSELEAAGFSVGVIWQCQTTNRTAILEAIEAMDVLRTESARWNSRLRGRTRRVPAADGATSRRGLTPRPTRGA